MATGVADSHSEPGNSETRTAVLGNRQNDPIHRYARQQRRTHAIMDMKETYMKESLKT